MRLFYVAAGTSKPLCDDCRRSFLPTQPLTVRAAIPLFNASAGYPKAASVRTDFGVAPAIVIGDTGAKTVTAAGAGLFLDLCLTVETTAAPKLCVMGSLDALFTSKPDDVSGVGSLAAAVQPNAMLLIGASAP